MNHAYRLVWNEGAQCYVPAAEGTRARGKSKTRKVLAALNAAVLSALSGVAVAGPTGGEVVDGQASISQSGVTTTVNQFSHSASLNWQQFNVAANETVQFVQPSSTAVALNRVIGNDASQIYGRLAANGQVFLVNPNGVLFAPGSQVDVGGLVASTLNISDADFRAGRYKFESSSSPTPASIVNEGSITVAPGGSVALLGGQVTNNGTITAQLGTVALAAGSAVSLDFSGRQLMNVQIDAPTLNALVQNNQLIRADGGTVLMTAAARDALLNTVVNNTGVIEARTIENKSGVIKLLGGFIGAATVPAANTGTTIVSGRLDASAANGGNGGFIETSGDHVKIADGTVITTAAPNGVSGEWLIDPADYTIAASGGDISGATLGANLENGNVRILSTQGTVNPINGNGDIFVNDAVTWSAATTLTLEAVRNVNVNAAITNTGSSVGSAVVLRADSTGACVTGASNCGTVSGAGGIIANRVDIYHNPTSYTAPLSYEGLIEANSSGVWMLVNDVNQLQAINTNLGGSYALGRDIDASATSSTGFTTLGNESVRFAGHFDGRGHVIQNLNISTNQRATGLFGSLYQTAVVESVGLVGGSIGGGSQVGALVGRNDGGTIRNSYSSASVIGSFEVGGLVGRNHGFIYDSYAAGVVRGNTLVGGLVGSHYIGPSNSALISNSHATGTVTGNGTTGGLVGDTSNAVITDSYATGQVTGVGSATGGLIGSSTRTEIARVYSTGNVIAIGDPAGFVGGLVGRIQQGSLADAWSSGSITSDARNLGGLVGSSLYTTVTNSYYDADRVAINGSYTLGKGALAHDQFQDWFGNGLRLDIADYSASLVRDASTDTYLIGNLQGLRDLLGFATVGGYRFRLTADIDLSSAPGFFIPDFNAALFDGAGHRISNLSLARDASDVGLFSRVASGSTIANLNLVGVSVSGRSSVGGLVGNNSGTVRDSSVTGTVRGDSEVGGLVGTVDIFGVIGGSYSNAVVSDRGSGTANIFGGLVGLNRGIVRDSYATGSVSGMQSVGGLIGFNDRTIERSYSTGAVSGSSNTGGLVGAANEFGQIVDSFWNIETSGQGDLFDGRGVGKTSEQMTQLATFANWNISSAGGSNAMWRIYEGHTAPLLRSFMQNVQVDMNDARFTYDATSHAVGVIYSGAGVDRSLISEGNALYRNAGTHDLGRQLYSGQTGYDISYTGGELIIDRAMLTVSGTQADKTYDGTVAATLRDSVLNGVFASDDVVLSESGAFRDKNAGTGKTVDVSFAIGGADGGNYVLAFDTAEITGDIARASISEVTGITARDKVYDASVLASLDLSGARLTGMAQGDDLVVGQAGGAFSTRNVAGVQTVSISGIELSGADAGNYNLVRDTASTTASITPRALTYTIVADDRSYDGTTGAAFRMSNLVGLVGNERLGVSAAASFNSKDVTAANLVTVDSITLFDGADGGLAGNYTIDTGVTSAARIAPRQLTMATTFNDKEYDGTTVASFGSTQLDGLVGTETVNLNITGSFNSKDVATANTVTIDTASLADGTNGGLASNYVVSAGDTGLARITPKALTYSWTADDKEYDGTTVASLNLTSLDGLVGNEMVSASLAASFNSKDVSTANTVTIDTATLADGANGGLASNYSIDAGRTVAARITPKALTYSLTADDKEYDGARAAAVRLTDLRGLVGDETVTASIAGSFNSKDVAVANLVTIDTATLQDGVNGGFASNYTIATGTSAGARITPKRLTYNVVAQDRVYDGTTAASVALTGLAGFIGNETMTASGTGRFNSRDVATANTVTVDNVTLSNGANGGLASNYSIAAGGTAAARITRANLTITADDQRRLMGTPNPEFTVTYRGFVAGEDVSVLGIRPSVVTTATPSSVVGTYAITADGAVADNYNITYTPGTLSIFRVAEPDYVSAMAYVSNQDTFNAGVEDERLENRRRGQLLVIESEGMRMPAGL